MTQRHHILVVDDEPNVLVTYRLILQQQGYDVSGALSADEARQILAAHEIDLLLCDLSLGKSGDGFEVIEYGREKKPRLPALLLTGYATHEACDRAAQLEIPLLFKPIDIRSLLATISQLLQSQKDAPETGA